MERTQNGVNGNIQQQPYGYFPLPIASQVPRGNPRPMYYENVPQVHANHMLPQFPIMSQNVPNSIGTMNPASFYYPQYNYPQQYLYNPQVFPPYTQEIQAQSPKNISNEQNTRKLSPLVVKDPNSNTNLDLSKFQNSSHRSDLDIQPVTKEVKVIKAAPFKDNSLNKDHSENVENKNAESSHHSLSEIEEKDLTPQKDVNIECVEDVLVSMENQEQENFDSLNSMKSDSMTGESDNKLTESIILSKNLGSLENTKFENDEELVNCSSEEDMQLVGTTDSKFSYHLPVNKKESDETTLKRKLIYDREYLIRMKDSNKSRQMPSNMPPTSEFSEDIISNTPRTISCQLPESTANQTSLEKMNKKQLPGRQYSTNYKKYNKPNERKFINLDIIENQVFVRSKSGYLPPQFRDKQSESDANAALIRNIKSNLNKITPQNFQECLAEIKNLNIDDKAMPCLISEIFIKAVKEEAYSVTYAQFCNKLAKLYGENQFKSQLLKKCQDMFETPLQDQLKNVRSDWENKISIELDLKLKSLYESDLEEQVKKAKDKYFGNIRFIGELFLHNLLASKVILNCIVELLSGSDDSDAMLALCKLLETCGKQIDLKHKDQMNKFIGKINELSLSNDLEKRIRFKLRDICDMRDRDWSLRHIQQEKKINPKTFQEQKEEAEAEASAAATKYTLMIKKRNAQGVINNNPRRNIPNSNSKNVAFKKLSCNTQALDEKTVLGPPLGLWSTGSGSKSKVQENDGWTCPKPKGNVARYTNNSRSREQSPQVILTNKYRNLESSAEASGADSRSSTPPLPYRKAFRVAEPVGMSDEERSEIIFSDLLSNNFFDVESWLKISKTKNVIEKWMDDMMEKDIICRRLVGDAFNQLLVSKKITPEEIVEGTQSFVLSIEDLICDIPKLWEFYAQFLERFISDKNSNISFFENMFKIILPNNKVALCLSMALHEASSRLGHLIAGQVFQKSLKWNSFVTKDVNTFVKENDLDFTIYPSSLSQHGGEPLKNIAEEVDELLSNDSPNEKIFEFLEKHLDKPTWKNSECTRTITSCILKAIKSKSDSSARCFFKSKMEIVKRISKRKTENEAEILKAILSIASELSKDTLIQIYDVLISDGIVANDTMTKYLNDKSLQSESNFKLTYQIISQITSHKEHL